mmetsp:Transcript_44128/g.84723  ORF Transcript_44128/g.84723 Transcript_44128/m.84723 type:complete len:275 (-) Transcript_44128:1126-1950(-)
MAETDEERGFEAAKGALAQLVPSSGLGRGGGELPSTHHLPWLRPRGDSLACASRLAPSNGGGGRDVAAGWGRPNPLRGTQEATGCANAGASDVAIGSKFASTDSVIAAARHPPASTRLSSAQAVCKQSIRWPSSVLLALWNGSKSLTVDGILGACSAALSVGPLVGSVLAAVAKRSSNIAAVPSSSRFSLSASHTACSLNTASASFLGSVAATATRSEIARRCARKDSVRTASCARTSSPTSWRHACSVFFMSSFASSATRVTSRCILQLAASC